MAESTNIEWAAATWNPWMGCHKVSEGCKLCYMFRDMKKYGRDGNIVVRSKTTFNDPLKWARNNKLSAGSRIFTCSWSDFFIEEADEWRNEAWSIIKNTPYTYLILTKRIGRVISCLPSDWGEGYPNVWLGTSIENQKRADERVPKLLDIPAKVRFLSCEPLLDKILLDNGESSWLTCNGNESEEEGCLSYVYHGTHFHGIDWVIGGGESDYKNPRPCNPDWLRSLRDQCRGTGASYFLKQLGGSKKINGTWGGRELDGRTWDEFPRMINA